jgi:hypothetical protein
MVDFGVYGSLICIVRYIVCRVMANFPSNNRLKFVVWLVRTGCGEFPTRRIRFCSAFRIVPDDSGFRVLLGDYAALIREDGSDPVIAILHWLRIC